MAFGQPVQADVTFSDYDGQWIGNGLISAGVDEPLRQGRCRATVQSEPSGEDLEIRGHCATVSASSAFAMRLVRDSGNRVRAGMSAQGLGETAQFAGVETGSRIELTSRDPVVLNGDSFGADIVIEFLSALQFTVNEWIIPSGQTERRQTVNMVFNRTEANN